MGAGRFLALAIGIVIWIIVFLMTYQWLAGLIGFGILGYILGALIAAVLGYLGYLVVMKLYGAAKS